MKRLSFEDWKIKVNQAVIKKTHNLLDCDSLPDWDYWNAWNDGMSVSSAASAVIKNAKEY